MRLRLPLVLVAWIAGCGASHVEPDPVEIIWVEEDADCDGTLDSCSILFEDGNVSSSARDHDCDGVPDVGCISDVVDDQGREVARASDPECNGEFEAWGGHGSRCSWTEYSEPGRSKWFYDGTCDGLPDNCQDRVHDEQDRVISEASDHGCDGSNDTCTTTFYDAGGSIRTERDAGCDGSVESTSCRIEIMDGDGNIIESGNDDDCDGVPEEYCAGVETDPHGERGFTDIDCDGVPELCGQTVVSDDGRTRTQSGDDGCDGTFDYGCGVEQVDAQGNLLSRSFDEDCDGPQHPHSCYSTSYDAQGRRISTIDDPSCSGAPTRCRTFEYRVSKGIPAWVPRIWPGGATLESHLR